MGRADDDALERLVTEADPDDGVLASMLTALRALRTDRVNEARAAEHIAAAARAARGEGPTSPTVVVPMPRGRSSRVRPMAAVAAALLVLVSGMGVAGALPGPIQSGLADLVRPVGIDLPDPDDEDPRAPRRGGEEDGDPGGAGSRDAPPVTPGPPSGIPEPPVAPPDPPSGPPAPPPSGPPSTAGPPPGTPTGPPDEPGPPG